MGESIWSGLLSPALRRTKIKRALPAGLRNPQFKFSAIATRVYNRAKSSLRLEPGLPKGRGSSSGGSTATRPADFACHAQAGAEGGIRISL